MTTPSPFTGPVILNDGVPGPKKTRVALVCLASVIAVLSTGCTKEEAEEAAVPVKAVPVQKGPMQRIVVADAVLFPLQQSALVPKISAPIKMFYVNRGAKVHKGQLLAVL